MLNALFRRYRDRHLIRRIASEKHNVLAYGIIDGFRRDTLIEFDLFHTRVGGPGSTDDMINKVRSWIRHVAAMKEANAVFMDTTTLYTAQALASDVAGKYLSPATLLDLSTFVQAVVLYDQIFHLESRLVDGPGINDKLGNEPIIVEIPVAKFDEPYNPYVLNGVGAYLGNVFHQTVSDLRKLYSARKQRGTFEYDHLEKIRLAWSTVLGFQINTEDILNPDEGTSWRSDGTTLLQDLLNLSREGIRESRLYDVEQNLERSKTLSDPSYVYKYISETNHRASFNSHISRVLQLPYASSITRMPFRDNYYYFAQVVHEQLESIKAINKYLLEYRPAYFVPDKVLRLPVFLSVALSRCSSLDMFYEVLADLRKQAEPFRRHRREYELALQKPNSTELISLRKAIESDASNLTRALIAPVASAFAAVLAANAGGTPALAVTGIGLLTAIGQFDEAQQDLLLRRLLRPEEWFLSNITQTARAITDSLSDVKKLWKCHMSDSYYVSRFEAWKTLQYG